MPTRSQQTAADVAALLRSRASLLWIVTREEARVEAAIFEAAASVNYIARMWDVAQGVTDLSGTRLPMGNPEPGAMLGEIGERARTSGERGVWIMRDLPVWLDGMAGAQPCRLLRNLARSLPRTPLENAQAIVVLSPNKNVPPELADHATVIDWPLPDREEIASILDAAIAGLPEKLQESAAPNGSRDAAIDAAVGLSQSEAQACYSRSLVQLRRIDPRIVAQEKKRLVARDGLLEILDPLPGGLDSVGGLDGLKTWLLTRGTAYSPAARAYGLPSPRGILLVGVSGCGKTLCAKAVSTAWNGPLVKMDLGALKGKYVGESESNLRKAFQTITAMGRCVVLVDEIEKALAGATQGAADGGVSADALGALLGWMQDRTGEAFVVATSNDVSALPPELLRKGRFDELFFVDLPTHSERMDVLATALRAHNRTTLGIGYSDVADVTPDYTGSEIAALVPDALFAAFADGAREITTEDLIAAASRVVPLATTMADRIKKLRAWGETNARRATTPTPKAARRATVALDV